MKNKKPESKVVPRGFAALLLALGLTACAGPGGNPKDPLEPLNRVTYSFNEKADRYVVRPLAEGYDYAPLPVKVGVGNFFGNLADLWIGVNNVLQGKVSDGLSDGGRFLVNSTVGIFGVFDIATELGLEKHDEDLGQTLGRWGVGDGPYLVLPLLGSSNLRDTAGLIVDFQADPVMSFEGVGARNRAAGLRLINRRAQLLGADTTAEQAALDKYEYVRSFYIQYRKSQIYDGRPPREKDPDDEADVDETLPASPAKKENQE